MADIIQDDHRQLIGWGWQEGLAEVAQLCSLMVTGHVEDVLQAQKRAERFSALKPARLLAILPKYRWDLIELVMLSPAGQFLPFMLMVSGLQCCAEM